VGRVVEGMDIVGKVLDSVEKVTDSMPKLADSRTWIKLSI